MSMRKPLLVPLGATFAIVFVVAWISVASAQTGFGVQRLSNGPRFAFPTTNSGATTRIPLSSQTTGTEPPTLPMSGASLGGAELPSVRNQNTALPITSVVRLIAFEKGGQSFGSGSYIGNSGEYGLILSNWHVVKDGDGLLHIHFPNGFSTFGAVIDSVEKWDLAIIVVSKPPSNVVPLQISRSIPVPGEPLWIAGHGSGSYRLAGGRCVRYLAPDMPKDGSRPAYDILELSVSARQGDSGGPILNQNGELAGVLFGSDMVRNTAGSHCGRASQFLLRTPMLLSRLPNQPEVYFASIEKEGPRRQLRETVNFTPTDSLVSVAAPSVVDIAGSSSSTFGVRSNSRRYVQNGSVTDRIPPSPPNSANGTPSAPPTPLPSLPPSSVPPPGPIQKAVWNPPEGSAPHIPPIASEGTVVQTGLSTGSVARASLPSEPFAEDLSALNPVNKSDHSYQIAQEHMRLADHSAKYAASSHSPYTLPAVQDAIPRNTSPSSILLFVAFLATGVLVLSAIRLIRTDAGGFEDEENRTEISLGNRQRSQAA